MKKDLLRKALEGRLEELGIRPQVLGIRREEDFEELMRELMVVWFPKLGIRGEEDFEGLMRKLEEFARCMDYGDLRCLDVFNNFYEVGGEKLGERFLGLYGGVLEKFLEINFE